MYRKVLAFLLTVLVVIAIAGCWILKKQYDVQAPATLHSFD